MNQVVTKTSIVRIVELGKKMEVIRKPDWWKAFYGIWRGKKNIDPVKWQRKIRQDRKVIQ